MFLILLLLTTTVLGESSGYHHSTKNHAAPSRVQKPVKHHPKVHIDVHTRRPYTQRPHISTVRSHGIFTGKNISTRTTTQVNHYIHQNKSTSKVHIAVHTQHPHTQRPHTQRPHTSTERSHGNFTGKNIPMRTTTQLNHYIVNKTEVHQNKGTSKVHIVVHIEHPHTSTERSHGSFTGKNIPMRTTTQVNHYILNKTEVHQNKSTSTLSQRSLYPGSPDLSGNNKTPKKTSTEYNTHNVHKTEIHHHHYSPPQQIGYGSASYPVYHAPPPGYVYEYKTSGSRFDNLLTGLALYNLGRMSNRNHNYDANRGYVKRHGEVCKLAIRKRNGDYEEARIDCKLMTSFILESDSGSNHVTDKSGHKSSVVTSEVKITQTNTSTGNNSVTTVTTTNTTIVDAREVKGKSIEVTPDMRCYLIRILRDTSIMKKEVKCGLLQTYARTSFRNSAGQFAPILVLLVFQFFLFEVM